MRRRWNRLFIGGGLALYLVGIGLFGGILIARVRFDRARAALPTVSSAWPCSICSN